MEIQTVRALHFCAVVCAFSIAGITGSSGGQIGRNRSVITLDRSGVTPYGHGRGWETPPPVLTPTVVTTGLEKPRGIDFGPERRLYVAEGGLGGSRSTVGQCPQVPAVGPYQGGFTARVSAVDVTTGVRTTIVDNLPSNQTTAATGGFVSGVADVKFLHRTLYALVAGGCSHGSARTFNSIDRISAPGIATPIVNLSQF